jgi:hypothetical protein
VKHGEMTGRVTNWMRVTIRQLNAFADVLLGVDDTQHEPCLRVTMQDDDSLVDLHPEGSTCVPEIGTPLSITCCCGSTTCHSYIISGKKLSCTVRLEDA